MDWIEAVITTTTKGIEPVTGVLIMNGISGYMVEDSQDFEDFLRDKEVYWDYIEDELMKLRHCDTTMTFYVTDDAEGMEQLGVIRNALETLKKEDTENAYGALSIKVGSIAEEDWANNWKQYFKPLPVGKSLLIKPTWESVSDTEGRKIIEIDPSSSFGTGSHTTTKLCLQYIETIQEKLNIRNYDMIDVGCGSGILGIAANKLSDCHVTAIDIEENSIRVAGENFDVNQVPHDKRELLTGSITDDPALFAKVASRSYKMLAANIVADVLKAMAPYFHRLLADDGYGVLSGILAVRGKEVADHFAACGFDILESTDAGDWTAILIRKRVKG